MDLALKALEIVYLANGASVEGLADRNVHRRKVVGEGKSVSWGGARTKGKGRECELAKKKFLHSDLLKLCLKKKRKINEFSLTQLQQITVQEHIFGEFALAPLTFEPCTSPTDTSPFTYHFSSVSIPISESLN